MPKVIHVRCAQKPNPVVSTEDIARAKNPKTEEDKSAASYYHWSLKTGPTSSLKRYSKTYPRQSALTTSEFWGNVYSIQEEVEDDTWEFDDLESNKDDIAERIREIGQECQDKFDNLPEGFQMGSTGEQLEARANSCEDVASNIEGIDIPSEDDFEGVPADEESGEPEILEEPEEKEGAAYERWREALDDWKMERAREVQDEVVSFLSDVDGG